MRSNAVVIVDPRLQVSISLLRIGPVFGICPFAQGGLDEPFGLSVGSRCVRSGTAVFDGHLLASVTELSGAIAGAVVGKKCAHADAMSGEDLDGRVQEADGGLQPSDRAASG